jgi:hypothetical protein
LAELFCPKIVLGQFHATIGYPLMQLYFHVIPWIQWL